MTDFQHVTSPNDAPARSSEADVRTPSVRAKGHSRGGYFGIAVVPRAVVLRVQVPGWRDFFDQRFYGLDRHFCMAITLAVSWRRVADSDAPSAHSGSENASVELGPNVGSETQWNAELDKICDDVTQYFPRGWVPFPPMNHRPSRQVVGVDKQVQLARLKQICRNVLEPVRRQRVGHHGLLLVARQVFLACTTSFKECRNFNGIARKVHDLPGPPDGPRGAS